MLLVLILTCIFLKLNFIYVSAYKIEKVFPWISHTENAINFDKCTMNGERTEKLHRILKHKNENIHLQINI